jgi:TonB family protein
MRFELECQVRRFLILLPLSIWLSVSATSQAQNSAGNDLPSVPSDTAKQNLVSLVQPVYPPLAKAARIVGIVRASIVIDSDGNVKDVKLISGHPMLAPSALEAIRKWKYKAFQVHGKTVSVQTEVEVSIPEHINQSDIDQERKFQDAYWPNEREARESLKEGDLIAAEAKLQIACAAAEERGDQKWLELADVLSMLGTVTLEQNDLEAAEKFYKRSLSVHEQHQRADEAEVAGAQESLGLLYFRARQPEKAEPLFLQSVKTYEARIRETPMPEPLAGYGRSLALGYFALSQISAADGRLQVSQDRCSKALSYAEKWSSASDKDVIISRCRDSSRSK